MDQTNIFHIENKNDMTNIGILNGIKPSQQLDPDAKQDKETPLAKKEFEDLVNDPENEEKAADGIKNFLLNTRFFWYPKYDIDQFNHGLITSE